MRELWLILRKSLLKTSGFFILILLIFSLSSIALCAERVRTAVPQANLNYLSVYVADARGFFRDEGLDNETVVIAARAAAACGQR
jgi:ABC-type nitrate/sulfonate/bicarbonate transport system substrate-binding protein